jgi:transposase
MKPYSQDLREKIIRAVEAGEETRAEIAEQYGVILSFVEKLWRRWRGRAAAAWTAASC